MSSSGDLGQPPSDPTTPDGALGSGDGENGVAAPAHPGGSATPDDRVTLPSPDEPASERAVSAAMASGYAVQTAEPEVAGPAPDDREFEVSDNPRRLGEATAAHRQIALPNPPDWLRKMGAPFRSSAPRAIEEPTKFVDLIGLGVAIACGFLTFLVMHPDLIFANTVTTGGDMGAHVVAPDFLKEHLLPFRLNGWSDAWYAGYPVYQFYMVVPALLIVLLDVGLPPLLGVGMTIPSKTHCRTAQRTQPQQQPTRQRPV